MGAKKLIATKATWEVDFDPLFSSFKKKRPYLQTERPCRHESGETSLAPFQCSRIHRVPGAVAHPRPHTRHLAVCGGHKTHKRQVVVLTIEVAQTNSACTFIPFWLLLPLLAHIIGHLMREHTGKKYVKVGYRFLWDLGLALLLAAFTILLVLKLESSVSSFVHAFWQHLPQKHTKMSNWSCPFAHEQKDWVGLGVLTAVRAELHPLLC